MTQRPREPKITLSGFGTGVQQAAIVTAVGYYFASQAGWLQPAPIPTQPEATKELQIARDNRDTMHRIEEQVKDLAAGRAPSDHSGVPIWHRHSREMQDLVRAIELNATASRENTVALNSLVVTLRRTSVVQRQDTSPALEYRTTVEPEKVGYWQRNWARLMRWLGAAGAAG